MKLEWNVYRHAFNGNEIEVFNVFNHCRFYEDCVKAKKKFKAFDTFSEEVRKNLRYYFWSKSEYEIILTSWPAYITKQELDRLNEEDVKYRVMVSPETCVKVDIYDQLMLNWDIFIEYVWNNKGALK